MSNQKGISENVGLQCRTKIPFNRSWFSAIVLLFLLPYTTIDAFTGFRSIAQPQHAILYFRERKSLQALDAKLADSKKNEETVPIPKHIAFICDGNSRWAEKRGLPASAGHASGADRLFACLMTLKKAGIKCCTMYGFSTENWKRDDGEIKDILTVVEQTAIKFHNKAMQENVRVKILGDIYDSRIPLSLQKAMLSLEEETLASTADFDDDACFTVCIAINYGGRQDIVKASINMAKQILNGNLDPEKIKESDFGSLLCTCGIPDPDLIVRTGGEKRVSNFLLWNLAYAELFFSDLLWPDFDEKELNKILAWFGSRSRRFGGRKEKQKVEASS
mmetsp:Transcript_12410/g.19105  ORF Transcript_12410/g.19105 Transcript_12410/m.19105 type:complete len:333 (-) Transcript_12410:2784-3782(-)